MTVELQKERRSGVLVVSVDGRLDAEGSADFELFTQEAVSSGERHLILDLAKLGYISNAGLRALASLAKSLNTPSTSLRVAGVQPGVSQTLDAAGVAILLDLRPNLDAALAGHPAARGDDLSKHLCRLLGIAEPGPIEVGPNEAKLAELAFELLAGQQHQHRAARAIAQGTQVLQRVSVPAGGAAAQAPAPMRPKQAPAKKLSFWQKLFGKRS